MWHPESQLYIFTHVNIAVMDKHVKRRQNLLYGLHRGWRILVATQVHHDPGHIPQEGDGYLGINEAQQRLHHPQIDDIIPQHRSIPDNVAQRPHGLLAHILMRAAQQTEKEGNSIGLDHLLGLRRSARRDVGEGPRGLELQGGVVIAFEAFDEHREDARVDEGVDRRVAVGGEEFASGLNGGQLGRRFGALGFLDDGVQGGRGQVVAEVILV